MRGQMEESFSITLRPTKPSRVAVRLAEPLVKTMVVGTPTGRNRVKAQLQTVGIRHEALGSMHRQNRGD